MGEGQRREGNECGDVPCLDLGTAFSRVVASRPRQHQGGVDLGSIFSRVGKEPVDRSPGDFRYKCPPRSPSHVSPRDEWRQERRNYPGALYMPLGAGSEGGTPPTRSPNFKDVELSLMCNEKLLDSSESDDHSTSTGSSDGECHHPEWFNQRSAKWFGSSPCSEPNSITKFLGASPEKGPVSWVVAGQQGIPVHADDIPCWGEGGGEVKDVLESLEKMGATYGRTAEQAIEAAHSYMTRLECLHASSGPIKNQKGWVITKRQLLVLCLHLAKKMWDTDSNGIVMAPSLVLINKSGPDQWSNTDVNAAVWQIFELLDYEIWKDLEVNPAGVDIFCDMYAHVCPDAR